MNGRSSALTRSQLASIDTIMTIRGDDPLHRVDLDRCPDRLGESIEDLLRRRVSER